MFSEGVISNPKIALHIFETEFLVYFAKLDEFSD